MRLSLCEAPTLKEQHKGQPQHRETSRPTAAGHDKVPMWSVKESINYISEPLTYITNLSINSGRCGS